MISFVYATLNVKVLNFYWSDNDNFWIEIVIISRYGIYSHESIKLFILTIFISVHFWLSCVRNKNIDMLYGY